MKHLFTFLFLFGVLSISAQVEVPTLINKDTGEEYNVYLQNDVPTLQAYAFASVPWQGTPISFRYNSNRTFATPNIHNQKMYPIHRNVAVVKVNGYERDFIILEPGYYVLVNDSTSTNNTGIQQSLVLCIQEPEVIPSGSGVINAVTDWGIDNTGKFNETVAIQDAIREAIRTNKTLVFPAGRYRSFKLSFESGLKLHLSEGARLLADSTSLEGYNNNDGLPKASFIQIKDAENIKVTGRGMIDNNGTLFRGIIYPDGSNGKWTMRNILSWNARNVEFDGICIKDAARWTVHLMLSDSITFRNCKLLNNPHTNGNLTNFDGWDPDMTSNFLLDNCFGWTNDDDVAIKTTEDIPAEYRNEMKNLTIRNSVFLTKKSSLKIGTETECRLISNVLFENCDVISSDRALAIDIQGTAVVDNVTFKDIRVDKNWPDSQKKVIRININNASARITNGLIENVLVYHPFPNKSEIKNVRFPYTTSHIEFTIRNLRFGDTLVTEQNKNTYLDLRADVVVE